MKWKQFLARTIAYTAWGWLFYELSSAVGGVASGHGWPKSDFIFPWQWTALGIAVILTAAGVIAFIGTYWNEN